MTNNRFFLRNKVMRFAIVCTLLLSTVMPLSPQVVLAVSQFTNYPTKTDNAFISYWFADPNYPGSGSHGGMDISYNGYVTGDIYAANEGVVSQIEAGCDLTNRSCGGSWGNHIIIDHGSGISTVYAHLSKVYVAVGQSITGGQHIADMGTTGRSDGIHLHFEVLKNGQKVDPFSYLYWNGYAKQLSSYSGSATAPSGTAQLPPSNNSTNNGNPPVQNNNPTELATIENYGTLENDFSYTEAQRNTKVTFRNLETMEQFVYTIENAQSVQLPYGDYDVTIDGLVTEGGLFDVKTASITADSPVSSVSADITSLSGNNNTANPEVVNPEVVQPEESKPEEVVEISVDEIKNVLAGFEPINLEQLLNVTDEHLLDYYNSANVKDIYSEETRRYIYDRIVADYPNLNLLTGEDYNLYRQISQAIIDRSDYTFSDLNTAYPSNILSLYNELLARNEGNVDKTVEELLPLITQTREAYMKRREQREKGQPQDEIFLAQLEETPEVVENSEESPEEVENSEGSPEEAITTPDPVTPNEPESTPVAPETPVEEIPEEKPEESVEEPTEPSNESSDQPNEETEQPADNSSEVEVPKEEPVEESTAPEDNEEQPAEEIKKPAEIKQQIVAPDELSDLIVQYINKETEEIIEFKVGDDTVHGIDYGEYTVTVKDYIDPVSKQPLKIDYTISKENPTLLTGFVLYVEGTENNQPSEEIPNDVESEVESDIESDVESDIEPEPTPEVVQPEQPTEETNETEEPATDEQSTSNDATNSDSSPSNNSGSNSSSGSNNTQSSNSNNDSQQPNFVTTEDLNNQNQAATPAETNNESSQVESSSVVEETVSEVDETIEETSSKTPLNLEANGLTIKPKNTDNLINVKPKGISNGSTFKFEIDGKEKNVVLVNVSTPSAGDNNTPAEKYGKEALERAKFLLENATSVQIEYDSGATKDSYNRELAYVWVDGYLLQEILVKEGLAKLDPNKNQGNTRYLSNLTAVETEAKTAKLGLWNSTSIATQVDKNTSVDGLTGITNPETTITKSESTTEASKEENKTAESTNVEDTSVIPEASTGTLPETGFKLNPMWLFVSGVILTIGMTLLYMQYRKHGSFAFITGKTSDEEEEETEDDLMSDDIWSEDWEDDDESDDWNTSEIYTSEASEDDDDDDW